MKILLIHGFPFNGDLWSEQRALPGAVAPHLPGFGGTAPGADSIDAYARGILGSIEGRFIGVGHSMGGYIALAMHRIAPERLAGIALVASRAAADSPEARAKREETARAVLERGVGVVEESIIPRLFAPGAGAAAVDAARALIRRASPQGVANALRAMASRPDATPQLANIAVPALVVAGRHDAFVPPAASESMARAIPNARLVWCERSGHMPMLEEPEAVSRALREFLVVSR